MQRHESRSQLLIALITFLLIAGCGQNTRESPSRDVARATVREEDQLTGQVSTEDLRRILSDKTALVLDTRPFMEYAKGHIPGALNVSRKQGLPISEYTSDVAEIGRIVEGDKAASLVLYCNGPLCGKSKRVAEALVAEGYSDVRRYQLGMPVWRALGGVTEIEAEGLRYVYQNDRTATFVDARSPADIETGSIRGAQNIPLPDVKKAKDDLRLPMEDHNTRIVVFGSDAAQARAVAEEIARNAFHNVGYFAGTYEALDSAIAP